MPQFNKGPITTGHARKLAQNFLRNKWILGTLIANDDAQSCWFSKDTLLGVLGLPLATDTKEIDGARFYYAAYEDTDNPDIPPKDKRFKGKMTLVIVATTRGSSDEEHLDILDNSTAYPIYNKDFREYNDGQLCPPPKCGRTGGLLDEEYVKP